MDSLTLILLLVLVAVSSGIFVLLFAQNRQRANEQGKLEQSLHSNLQQNFQQTLQTLLQQMNNQQQSQERHSGMLHNRVAEAGRAVAELQNKLTALEEGNKRILDMSRGITELQNILQAPKLRGSRGEMWLEELLAQMIPRDRFAIQHRFKSGEICDAVIFLRDNTVLPIDSKFTLENFKKMLEADSETEQKGFEKAFASDVKKRVDEIAKRYILPDEGTLDFAFMYVPAENVYYQAFVEDRGGHDLQRYAFERHVIPVSPNSLYPYLEIVMFGLRGLEIERSARQIQQSLTGLQGDLGKFSEAYDKVGNNLRLAQQNFSLSDKRLGSLRTNLRTLSNKDLGTTPAIEAIAESVEEEGSSL